MAEYFLMSIGAAVLLSVAIIAAWAAFDWLWRWRTNFDFNRRLHHNAYQAGFQDGYDSFRKDADLPPLPSSRLKQQKDESVINLVVGWREYDWPEGFDRGTAQMIADHVTEREQQTTLQ